MGEIWARIATSVVGGEREAGVKGKIGEEMRSSL
jgi:hypothetical protein